MLDRDQAEALLLQNLERVDRICGALCRGHGLAGDDADEFVSWARVRMMDDDYAILRRFRGECAPATFLTVVLASLLRSYRVHERGRWRPTAAARREGALAVRLETLVRRDGLRLDQAGERLRTAGVTTLSDRELAALLERLPARAPLRPVAAAGDALPDAPAASGLEADRGVLDEEEGGRRAAAAETLRRALETLPLEDRVVVRMRFWEALSVAEIARGLGVPQKPLYKRLDRVMARLRKSLEAAGFSRERARELLEAEP